MTTGNKSEMSVGYATLYGDMCGGYSVLKDVYKTEVYALSHWRNEHQPRRRARAAGTRRSRSRRSRRRRRPSCGRIRRTRTRCRPTTSSTRSCRGWSRRSGASPRSSRAGSRATRSTRVQRLLYSAEYKRRQAPPGVKITRQELRPRPPLSDHQRASARRRETIGRLMRRRAARRHDRRADDRRCSGRAARGWRRRSGRRASPRCHMPGSGPSSAIGHISGTTRAIHR